MSSGVATWSRVHYSSADGSTIPARWGCAVSFLPHGLSSTDTGVTALVFGGANNGAYLGDVCTINLLSGVVRTLVPTQFSASDTAPFARAYMEWTPLPHGYGQGNTAALDLTRDSGVYYLHAGMGASDGTPGSDADHDWLDEWLFDAATSTWHRPVPLTCSAHSTTCTDAAPLTSILTQFTSLDAATAGPALDLSATLRPSAVYAAVQRLTTAITDRALTPTTLTDDTSACSTSCTAWEVSATRVLPAPSEGARSVRMGGRLFTFGGYSCSQQGKQQAGGLECYTNDMMVLDFSTMKWTRLSAPSDTDPSIWPSPRAYFGMGGFEERHLIIITGGAYQDVTTTFYYMSDTYAFDTLLLTFVPITIRGIPPLATWSAGAAALGEDEFYYQGGCAGTVFYDQLLVLRIGLAISKHITAMQAAGVSPLQSQAALLRSLYKHVRVIMCTMRL